MTDRKSPLTRTDARLKFFGHIARADPSMDPAWAAEGSEKRRREDRGAEGEWRAPKAPSGVEWGMEWGGYPSPDV